MKRVAIIVQRCHESIVGGSESLAWQYATLLKDSYEVDVLATTAVDAAYWENVLPEGLEVRDRINIRRFHVDIGYSPYRTEIFSRMLQDFERFGCGRHAAPGRRAKQIPWSIPLQEELVRRIGPYSASLVKFVRDNWSDYRSLIVVTYLYPTAYFSQLEIPSGRALFAPTLHDEQPAYLSVFKHAAHRAHEIIWLTDAERRLGVDLWGELPGRVVAGAIDARRREPKEQGEPYLLYCGRIDPNKGCGELFDYFIRFKEENPSPLRLVLTGKDDVPVPSHPEIDFRGFVSAEEKFSLMAGAAVYVMPSGKESFSIVTLEAMAQETPVLVTERSDVLTDHVRESGGGLTYSDYESFAARLGEMLSNERERERMGRAGREYVVERFVPERIRQALIEAVESCPEPNEEVGAARRHASIRTRHATRPGVKGEEQTAPPPLYEFSGSTALPLPPGWSEHELLELLLSVRVEDGPAEELKNYARSDFKRFVYTLGLVPERPGQTILELGANPYFTTTLLSKFRDAELHLANFFDTSSREAKQKVTIHRTGEAVEYSFRQFNIEEDAFPYEDNLFDVVLFCEIIEHLLSDPVHALAEVRRVLKPGGILVLTTPNVARAENVRKMIAGENIYDPYSGYGAYGRHNREYTKRELSELLSANGFIVKIMFTADVNQGQAGSGNHLNEVIPLLNHRRGDLGQYIFCQCEVNKESKDSRAVRPRWLYRSMARAEESER
ncbi:MAG: glycosyltransferase [Acidobacteriota bacterium]|nr:glycosyltransferase [Acidobacteriota bacterium]